LLSRQLGEAITALFHDAATLMRSFGPRFIATMGRPFVLLLLDPGEHLTEPLVVDDGGMGDGDVQPRFRTLIMVALPI
jgi:hypothetical protein